MLCVQATAAASFFQVLVEILKVEISLLLNDALSIMHASSTSTVEPSRKSAEPINASPLQPKAQMPLAPPAHSPSKASSAAPDSRYKAGLPHAAQSSTDNSKPTGNSTADPSSSWSGALPDSNHTKIGISPETSSEKTPEGLLVEEATQDGKRQRDDHTTSPAEARVTGVLPAVFSLMEGCLQALAADAQAAEDTQGGSRLDDKVSQRAMQALSEAFETVLQFLELVHAEGLGQESPWVLAAVRAVGRQVPSPFLCCICT